jgi:hypothetical protein
LPDDTPEASANQPDIVAIARDDLDVITELVMLRLQLRAPESRRLEALRTLIALGANFTRALSNYTQRALVECDEGQGTGELLRDGDVLFDALTAYGAAVRAMAAEYHALVRDVLPIPRREPLPAPLR